jgi:hypothetical protein
MQSPGPHARTQSTEQRRRWLDRPARPYGASLSHLSRWARAPCPWRRTAPAAMPLRPAPNRQHASSTARRPDSSTARTGASQASSPAPTSAWRSTASRASARSEGSGRKNSPTRVRCLAGTNLGRPLAEWDAPWVYQRGIVEQCEQGPAARVARATCRWRPVTCRKRRRSSTARNEWPTPNSCGLPFEEACLRFYENTRAVRTASSEQVRQPIFRDAVDQWRHYEPWLTSLVQALGPALTTYPDAPAMEPLSIPDPIVSQDPNRGHDDDKIPAS